MEEHNPLISEEPEVQGDSAFAAPQCSYGFERLSSTHWCNWAKNQFLCNKP